MRGKQMKLTRCLIEQAEIPRYSDKYRESWQSRPTLVKKDLHQPFFPPNTFEEYFHPKKKRKSLFYIFL